MKARDRIQIEDALKHLYQCAYEGIDAGVDNTAGALGLRREQALDILHHMVQGGLARLDKATYRLTDAGKEYAVHLVRAHRLYETYLARQGELEPRQWHHSAEKAEHRLTPEQVDHLADELGRPRFDPHGDPIPTRDGEMPPLQGASVLDLPDGWKGKVVHVADEPEQVNITLTREGFAPGMHLTILSRTENELHLELEGRRVTLPLEASTSLRATELEEGDPPRENISRLSSLESDQSAEVVGLSPACRGPERTRLLDLGIVPGSPVSIEFASPFRSPTAYRIRGSVIALRHEQAEQVFIRKGGPDPS